MKATVIILCLLNITIFGQEFNSINEADKNPKIVIKLDLSEKDLKTLPSQFSTYVNLEEIDLSANPNLDFRHAINILTTNKKLKILHLSGNNLSELPGNITNLKKLKEIMLDENNFTDIPESLLELKHLEHISFFDNKIPKISLKETDLPNLESINLCYNNLVNFPTDLSKLKNLKYVIMWYSNVGKISSEIGNFKKIEVLNLEGNQIENLPSELSELQTLKKISFRNNRLKTEDLSPLWKLKNLEELEIERNDIKEIPSEISQLTKLKRLSIGINPIKTIPTSLSELNNLEQLGLVSLSDFNWTETFNIISKIKSLRRIGFPSSGLTKMPDGFEKLTQIKTFWINGNAFDSDEQERLKKLLPNSELEFNSILFKNLH